MKASDILCRVTQLKLIENVVTNPPGCTCGKSRDRTVGKVNPQAAQLAVFGPEFVSPLRDAMGLVDREKCDGHTLQPADRVSPRQPFGGKIEQTVFAVARLPHH